MDKQNFIDELNTTIGLEEFYLSTYPFLKNFQFPPDFDMLRGYYKFDMESRNLTPLINFYENYGFVFSYFLENYTKEKADKFIGGTFFSRLDETIPDAIKQTGKDLSFVSDAVTGITDILSGLGSALKNFWFIIIPLVIFLFLKK